MKRIILFFVLISCTVIYADSFIADHLKSKESSLRKIPVSAINEAKSRLHILYCGTSHSTQVVDGLRGLMQYKTGDNTLYAVSFDGNAASGELDIHYNRTSGTDLSHDSVDGSGHTGYYYGTVSYLDSHPEINVVMWSWCSIEGHDTDIYLNNFAELINMYKAGGTKGRTSANEVKFVFMTGYARGGDSDTPEPPYIRSPYQNHKRIVDYCKANGYFCLDYWSQDVFHYETDVYKPTESGNDNVQHKAYFDTHSIGVHWFETRSYSSGSVKWPAHCEGTPQHITSNRRAYGAWWIFARLAGWSEGTAECDFNSDGKTDILWRNLSTGLNYVWFMDGTNKSGGTYLDVLRDTAWEIVGTGDFNSDGKVDILWRNMSTGDNYVWIMNGVVKNNGIYLQRLSDTAWEIVGTGDFNSDGKVDILWRHSVIGANYVWYMNGVVKTGGSYLPGIVDADWKIAGTGDFNSDGKVDVLWRHVTKGANYVWYMDGVTREGGAYLPGMTNFDWVLSGTGDFNSDLKVDVLWRNKLTGENYIWIMDGVERQRGVYLEQIADIAWEVVN